MKKIIPQPTQHLLDVFENPDKNGEFFLYSGNEMEGHILEFTLQAPNLNVEPYFDYYNGKVWIWKKLSENTLMHREYWKKNKIK